MPTTAPNGGFADASVAVAIVFGTLGHLERWFDRHSGGAGTMTTTPTWGPFKGPIDASRCLGGFVDAHVGPEVGICWKGSDALVPIRRPSWDGDGYGSVLIVRFDEQSPTHPGARLGFFASVERALQ